MYLQSALSFYQSKPSLVSDDFDIEQLEFDLFYRPIYTKDQLIRILIGELQSNLSEKIKQDCSR